MDKCSYISLAPYLLDGVFVITHNTGEMYMHINGKFIRRIDGLAYTYNDIPPIYIITKINYHFIAMGINRWNIEWCFRNRRYSKELNYTDAPF